MNCHYCGAKNPAALSSCLSCGTGLVLPPEQASDSSSEAPTSRGFVGRQHEMSRLMTDLTDVIAGQGRLVLLAGEPGIGKTRTAQEVAHYGAQLGAQVLWGRCYEEAGAPPYWPWVQALRSWVLGNGPEQLRSQMGPGAATIAEILPEVHGKLPGLDPPPALESPERSRFRLFDALTTFLKNAAHARPLLLVLDDLHWADRSSLLLLEFLAREMSESHLLLLGCYRDVELSRQHPLVETLAQLSRETVFQRVPLQGLSREDAVRYIEATSGVRSSQGVAETIYAHTEGNPFFMKEVVRLLKEQGELLSEVKDGRRSIIIPEGVREVVGRRLNRLSQQCHQVLTTASIIGREFDFQLLSLLSTGVSEEQLLSVIDEALEAHLIEELAGSAQGYQFGHALVQETLVRELSAARRVRLHARISQALEEMYGADAGAHASVLAYHFGEAAPVLGTEKLVRYSLLAGERALAAYAYEEALVHFQRGLAAKGVNLEGQKPARDGDEATMLFGLARAQAATLDLFNQADLVIANLTRAFDYYEASEEVDRAIAVAEFRTTAARPQIRAGARLIDRALAMVPPDSHAEGRLLAHQIRILGVFGGDYSAARQAAEQALAIARREHDQALELFTLGNYASLEQQHAHYQEAAVLSEQAIALSRYLDDLYSEDLARHVWQLSRQIMGEGLSEPARQNAAAMLSKGERHRDHNDLANALWINATMAYQEGDWEAARQHLDRYLELAPGGSPGMGLRVTLEYQTGEFGQGAVYLERLLELMRRTTEQGVAIWLSPPAVALAAYLNGDTSRVAETEALIQSFLLSPSRPLHHVIPARSALALMAVQRGDLAQCRAQYQALKPHPGITLIGSTLTLTDRILGLLSHTLGNLDTAAQHFEDALAYCRKSRNQPELALTCCDHADTLLQRNATGDHANAVVLLEESWSIATELRLRPLMERVHGLQEQAQSRGARTPAFPDGLSQREVEVLRLIAAGKTDREIARELVISSRTVNNHVRSILNKTAVANRTEAASYATRQGLV